MSLTYAAALEKDEQLYATAIERGYRAHSALPDAMHGGCPDTMAFLLERLDTWEMLFVKNVVETYKNCDHYGVMLAMMTSWYQRKVIQLAEEAWFYHSARSISIPT